MADSNGKRTVLITGCSDGGLGAALAVAFQDAGLHVYATARNVSKMSKLAALGIDTIALDVQSESSVAQAVARASAKSRYPGEQRRSRHDDARIRHIHPPGQGTVRSQCLGSGCRVAGLPAFVDQVPGPAA